MAIKSRQLVSTGHEGRSISFPARMRPGMHSQRDLHKWVLLHFSTQSNLLSGKIGETNVRTSTKDTTYGITAWPVSRTQRRNRHRRRKPLPLEAQGQALQVGPRRVEYRHHRRPRRGPPSLLSIPRSLAFSLRRIGKRYVLLSRATSICAWRRIWMTDRHPRPLTA